MSDAHFDVAVIGGGVVGCAVLFELTCQGYSCIMLEKNHNIMSEASAGNSGILHTGFDAPQYSLEQYCILSCQKRIFEVMSKFRIPFENNGAILVAWTEQQNEKIPTLRQNAHEAGILDADFLNLSELYKREPFLREGAHGALHVPGESVIDSNLLGICLAHHARQHGAKILTNCEVIGFKDKTLNTTQRPISAKVTINCAGLYGDIVDSFAGISTFRIKPRKGQYCVFAKQASHLLNSMIFPVPTEKSKGIAVFNSVYNNVCIGPTADDIPNRTRPSCDPIVHKSLNEMACWMIPELNKFTPIGQYTGVRPATEFKDYQIQTYPQIGWITVGGIRSTGVSASLGIAHYVSEKLIYDMEMEAGKGSMKHIAEMTWNVGSDRKSVIIDGVHYCVNHPIFAYGHQNVTSNL